MIDKIILAFYVGTSELTDEEVSEVMEQAHQGLHTVFLDDDDVRIIVLKNDESMDSYVEVLHPKFIVMDEDKSNKILGKLDAITDNVITKLNEAFEDDEDE